jgi:hypothetical protein
MPAQRRTEGTGGRKGPPRRPANDSGDRANLARPGSARRKDRPASGASPPSLRPGARAPSAERRSDPAPGRNGASEPRRAV